MVSWQRGHSVSSSKPLSKSAKLKEQGILSEAEFMQMNQDLIKKIDLCYECRNL